MKTTAIVIGVSNYNDPCFEALPGARADAGRFAASLVSWGLPKEWTHLLINEKATKANIVRTFDENRFNFDVDARLIVYFAGHGIRERHLEHGMPESALILQDSLSKDPLSTGLKLVELMQLIRGLKPAQVFLFIDACHLRLNQIENPLNDADILSATNSKGLFCLFSSGVKKSYEDIEHKYGYFTGALLKSISELRRNNQANCHDIVKKVAASLQEQALPLPEAYHIGCENMWPLEKSYEIKRAAFPKKSDEMILRWEALAKLQDFLVSIPDPIIWMWGEGGRGKTVIAEQLCKENASIIYTSIPNNSNAAILSLIEQLRLQKSELFFDRPLNASLLQTLDFLFTNQPNSILIIDHIDRALESDLNIIISEIDQLFLPCLFISRFPCKKNLFKRRRSKIFDWKADPLSLEEIEQMIVSCGQDPSISPVLLNVTEGNAQKVRQTLAHLSGKGISTETKMTKKYIKHMTAIVACGGFLDWHLFCQTFKLEANLLSVLEKLGLIHYTKECCFPHDLLIEMVENNHWPLDLRKAGQYWNKQVSILPYNRWACRSLIVLASQWDNCSYLKHSLSQCLETLNQKVSINYLMDLAQIFKKENWEELLLKLSEILLDIDEQEKAGEILIHLQNSSKRLIKNHVVKNYVKRLLGIGDFFGCIELGEPILKKCKTQEVIITLRCYLGLSYFFLGDFDKGMQLFQDNINCQDNNDDKYINISKQMAGKIMLYKGENSSKVKVFMESSLKIFETVRFYQWDIIGLINLSEFSYRYKQWNQSLYYLKKAEEKCETLQQQNLLLFVLKYMAKNYLKFYGAQSQELSQVVEKLENLLTQTSHKPNWVHIWVPDSLANIYAHRRELHKLQSLMSEIEPRTKSYKTCYIFTLLNLGHLAALKNDKGKAKQYYQKSLALAQEINYQVAIDEIHQDIALFYRR